MGIEHKMREPRITLNGERVGDYDLRYKSVALEAGAIFEAEFDLNCMDCELQAQALREDVQLVRLQMPGESQSVLISLRQEK